MVDYGFKYVIWNYYEVGYGKGVLDGVGVVFKRFVDF